MTKLRAWGLWDKTEIFDSEGNFEEKFLSIFRAQIEEMIDGSGHETFRFVMVRMDDFAWRYHIPEYRQLITALPLGD